MSINTGRHGAADPQTEAADPMVLDVEQAGAMLASASWRRFAVLGDSTAAGTGDPWPGYTDIPWADRLAQSLRGGRPDFAYLNTGRVGATIDQVRREQLQDVVDFRPDLVHVSCGGNDLFLRDCDLAAVETDLDALCGALAPTGAQLSMFTLADAFVGRLEPLRPRFELFAEMVRRVGARHRAVITDLWAHPARLRRNWLSADQIHLTTAGHAVVASEVCIALADAVRAPR